MFVYNDLKTDARVMRTIETLSKKYELVVYSIGEKKSWMALKIAHSTKNMEG